MPQTEAERLEAVSRFLQIKTTKDADLEFIVGLAAEICGVPTALITLIGTDFQYIRYKKNFGFDKTRREDAFCDYVIKEGAAVVVPDAREDLRFRENPLVENSPNICFYAGVPLTTHDGMHLGSLCVIDQVPGALSDQQRLMLEILASQVVQLLEYEASLQILQEQFTQAKEEEIKMMSFFQSLGCAHILLDKELHVLAFNKIISDFLHRHYKAELCVGMKITEIINDDFSEAFIECCGRALHGEVVKGERHLKYPDTEYWWEVCYEPAFGSDGEIIGVSFNGVDISERVRTQQLQKLREQMLNSIAFVQAHGLRRPISSIKGLLNMLEAEGVLDNSPNLQAMNLSVGFIDQKIHQIIAFTKSVT